MILITIFDELGKLDRELFTFIHAKASSPSIDWFMKLMRNANTWIPLYAFMLFWVIKYHRQWAWQFILMTLVCFAVTDFVSASVFKPLFARLRPCHDPLLQPILRDLVGCGGQYGMPSSHATNHFGLAAFWYASVSWMSNRKWTWLWIWAALICYAQVYVGKHYPFDTLVGGALGTAVGLTLAMLMKKWLTARKA